MSRVTRVMGDEIKAGKIPEGVRIGVTDFVATRCERCKRLYGAYRARGHVCNICLAKRAKRVNGTKAEGRYVHPEPRFVDRHRGRAPH